MSSSEILKEEENPYKTFRASVESDGRAVYMYLQPFEGVPAEPRAVWVMNLIEAPEDDSENAQKGRPPALRREACKHPQGLTGPSADAMDFVWFQEGPGVSLFVDGKLAACIPPFWDPEGKSGGFAAEALLPDNGTFPMPAGMRDRADENLKYWNRRTEKTFWPAFRDRLLADYEQAFGKHSAYYIMDGGKFPAMALAEFPLTDGLNLYATIGMSAQNMPGVEMAVENPEPLFRIELLTVREKLHPWLLDALSRTSLLPWRSVNWVGPGHTIEFIRPEPYSSFLVAEEHLVQDPALRSVLDRLPETTLDARYKRTFLFLVPADRDDFRVAHARGRQHLLSKIKVLDRFNRA